MICTGGLVYANKNSDRGAHPLCGHSARLGVCVLYEKIIAPRRAAGADRLCRRGHGGRVVLEPALPRTGAIRRAGAAVISARVHRVLAGRRVSAGAGYAGAAPASGCHQPRRPQKRLFAHDDAGAGGDAAQHPGGYGRRRRLRRVLNGQRADHGDGRAGAVGGHCDPKLSGGCDYLDATESRGHEPGQGVLDGHTVRRGGAAGCAVHHLGGGAGRARPAVSAQLRGGRDDLRRGRGIDPRNVAGRAFQYRYALLCHRLHDHDGLGCRAGVSADPCNPTAGMIC